MKSPILPTAARYLLPLFLVFSIFLLARGHQSPGGAFVGGLVAAAAMGLYAIALDVPSARRIFRVSPFRIMSVGMVLTYIAAVIGLFLGDAFFTAYWGDIRVPVFGTIDVGTPLLFEAGIYLIVLGAALGIILMLAEQ
jgi:multicomponent Na+:H+ antiporter subunit B